ncbi:hypothetical protein D9M70_459680 [compost metagenome]
MPYQIVVDGDGNDDRPGGRLRNSVWRAVNAGLDVAMTADNNPPPIYISRDALARCLRHVGGQNKAEIPLLGRRYDSLRDRVFRHLID